MCNASVMCHVTQFTCEWNVTTCTHACYTCPEIASRRYRSPTCKDTRKSTSGHVFMIGGGPVSWRSKKQTVTALSSCKRNKSPRAQQQKKPCGSAASWQTCEGTRSLLMFESMRITKALSTRSRIKRSTSATSTLTYSIIMSVTLLQQVRLSLFTAQPKR